jgi:hypothetical protein
MVWVAFSVAVHSSFFLFGKLSRGRWDHDVADYLRRLRQ